MRHPKGRERAASLQSTPRHHDQHEAPPTIRMISTRRERRRQLCEDGMLCGVPLQKQASSNIPFSILNLESSHRFDPSLRSLSAISQVHHLQVRRPCKYPPAHSFPSTPPIGSASHARLQCFGSRGVPESMVVQSYSVSKDNKIGSRRLLECEQRGEVNTWLQACGLGGKDYWRRLYSIALALPEYDQLTERHWSWTLFLSRNFTTMDIVAM